MTDPFKLIDSLRPFRTFLASDDKTWLVSSLALPQHPVCACGPNADYADAICEALNAFVSLVQRDAQLQEVQERDPDAILPRPDMSAYRAVTELIDSARWLAENFEPQSSDPVRRVHDAIAAVEALPTEIDRLRTEQADKVMPTIGPLIDAWLQVPNDLRGDLADSTPSFDAAMRATIRAVGTEGK